MNRKATRLVSLSLLLVASSSFAQVQGTSSSQTPYIVPTHSGVITKSIFTVGDTIGGYRMVGIPDGLGAYSNNDGTFTLLMNHELGATLGSVRAHGSTGAFVSKWNINSSTLAVNSGQDLIQTIAPIAGGAAPINRLCSGDLPATNAFYNAISGLGTQDRIFMSGEEAGAEGRVFGHVATGANAGTSYYLPKLGRFSWENAVASQFSGNNTLVIGTDDSTPGQVYLYKGSKTATGSAVERAGLTNGTLMGIKVNGVAAESRTTGIPSGFGFSLFDLGDQEGVSGATLQSSSVANGVTEFLRPEDFSWDPTNPGSAYFVTTDRFNDASTVGRSRLWRLNFNDVSNPTGGTIDMVLDGTEGQQMMDNITVDKWGRVLIQEDVGNNAHVGRILMYDPLTQATTVVAEHDRTRFLTGGANFLTQDEESSGIIDASSILGDGWYLMDVQAHYSISGELVEGGQLDAIYIPRSVPEPTSMAVLGLGVAGLIRRRKATSKK